MAKDSKRVRKIRRLKNNARQALKIAEFALNERDQYRNIVARIAEEQKKRLRPDLEQKPEDVIDPTDADIPPAPEEVGPDV